MRNSVKCFTLASLNVKNQMKVLMDTHFFLFFLTTDFYLRSAASFYKSDITSGCLRLQGLHIFTSKTSNSGKKKKNMLKIILYAQFSGPKKSFIAFGFKRAPGASRDVYFFNLFISQNYFLLL